MTWKNFLWKFALENYIFHIFSHFIYEISFKNFDHSHFIIPIQSDKVVCAKIYRRSFVFSFPRKSYQFVFVYWRAHISFTPEFSRKDSGMWPKARTLSLSSSLEHMPSEEVEQPEYLSTKHLLFRVSNIFAVQYFLSIC